MKKAIVVFTLFLTTLVAIPQDASRVLTGSAEPPLPFNIIKQPGFENRTTGWSHEGGGVFTTTSEFDHLARGRFSAKWTPPASATAGTAILKSDAVTIPAGLMGRDCRFRLLYKGDAATNGTMEVYAYWYLDDTLLGSDILGTTALPNESNYSEIVSGIFTCPTSGTLQMRVVNSATTPSTTTALYFDEFALADASSVGMAAGITALGAVGSSPNANAATLSGATINLEPASGSFPGVVTTGTQTFAGAKTFTSNITGNLVGNVTGNASTATALASNPTDCAADQFAYSIDANGNFTCASVFPSQGGNAGKVLTTNGSSVSWTIAGAGIGDVVGPASSTDNALVRYDGTTGKLVQNSGATLSDVGALALSTTAVSSGFALEASKVVTNDGSSTAAKIRNNQTRTGSATTSTFLGLDVNLTLSGSQNYNTAFHSGFEVEAFSDVDPNTVANLRGGYIEVRNRNSGIITNAYGLQIDHPQNDAFGDITTGYALYISGAPTALTSYGIYVAAGNSYFGGNLLLKESGGGSDTITLAAPSVGSSYTLTLPTTDGNANEVLKTDGSGNLSWTAAAGDVVGPASATDNAIVRYDSTTGKLIQNSSVTISDIGLLTTPNLAIVETGGGVDTVTVSVPSIGANYTLTLPTNDGDANQALVTDGSGNLSWAAAGGWTMYSNENISGSGSISSSTTVGQQYRRISGNGGAVTASTTPFGAVGGWNDGTVIRLIGGSNANTVTITHNDAAKGAILNGTATLGQYDVLELQYDSTADRWIEISRSIK